MPNDDSTHDMTSQTVKTCNFIRKFLGIGYCVCVTNKIETRCNFVFKIKKRQKDNRCTEYCEENDDGQPVL